MQVEKAIDEFLYATDYPEKTRKWYQVRLAAFTAFTGAIDTSEITVPLVRRYINSLNEREIKKITQHGYGRAVRAFVHFLEREDIVTTSVAARIKLPKFEKKITDALTRVHLKALYNAAGASETPALCARNKAIIAVLSDSGVRASELCGIKVTDVSFEGSIIRIKVFGKGSKERSIPLGKESSNLLRTWLNRYHDGISKYVFTSKKTGVAITPEGLHRLLYTIAAGAGLEDLHIHPHMFRHSYAINAVKAGMNIYDLSYILGHTSLATTEVYLRGLRGYIPHAESVLDQM